MTPGCATEDRAVSLTGISRGMEAACAPPFSGGIIENCARFRFRGTGYDAMPKEQDGYFRIDSARQIAGPMSALTDDLVRIVHVIGATQVLKSMVGDAWVMYCFEHILMPMLVLFEDDDKADLFCSRRLMETLRHHPEISRLVEESKKESRHNITGTWLKIAAAELLVAGLNEGNVSTLTWPLVWVSEAWQHGADGLLGKAFKRTDRYPDTFKILNESQASEVNSDLHLATKKAHPVPLAWKCPACDGPQTWEWEHWNHRRPENFQPLPRKKVSLATIGGQTVLIETDLPQPGTYAGMKWSFGKTGETVDNRSLEEKSRAAVWECIWCGHRIRDTRAERMAICETYSQDYRIASTDEHGRAFYRIPREVCFTIPFEAAWDNRFEKTVANFLIAKEAQRQGNKVKMRDWHLSERARFVDPQEDHRHTTISIGSYDPARAKELFGDLFHSLNMAVDCQQDQDHFDRTGVSIAGWFWFIVRAFDKFGNSQQVARGFCKSWAAWLAVQKHWGVPNDRVIIDSVQWAETVINRAVENRQMVKLDKPHPIFKTMERIVTWKLLAASPGRSNFKGHRDGNIRPWSPESPVNGTVIDGQGRPRRIPLMRTLFNKTPIQQQVDSLYSQAPGMPKFEVLASEHLKNPDGTPDALTLEMETGMRTYPNQMSAQIYNEEQKKYVELRPDDHYYWCEQALVVRVAMDGLLGQSAIFQSTQSERDAA